MLASDGFPINEPLLLKFGLTPSRAEPSDPRRRPRLSFLAEFVFATPSLPIEQLCCAV
jgi:hypothetical protein